MSFLPDTYDVPQKSGSYMKFQDGENRFRILCSPILGYEWWQTQQDGSRKPIRVDMTTKINTGEVEDLEAVKHFWAMCVWNYAEEKVQILEITQKGLQKKIRAYAKDEDWGSPLNYDLVVTKEGKELNTKYDAIAKPAKKLDAGITAMYEGMQIDLTALYRGEDPFSASKKEQDDQVADDVEKGLS